MSWFEKLGSFFLPPQKNLDPEKIRQDGVNGYELSLYTENFRFLQMSSLAVKIGIDVDFDPDKNLATFNKHLAEIRERSTVLNTPDRVHLARILELMQTEQYNEDEVASQRITLICAALREDVSPPQD